MKLTKEALKKLIKEELEQVVDEGYTAGGDFPMPKASMGVLYNFNDEQKEALKWGIDQLERGPKNYDWSAKVLRHLAYRHPAFKGENYPTMALQDQMKRMGYEGKIYTTTAVP
mgnify:FL=1|jgi:hypothetical protein